MLVLIGLIVLLTAVAAGIACYHIDGSNEPMLLVVIGLVGLGLLLAGYRRGASARRDLRQSRRGTSAMARDHDEHPGATASGNARLEDQSRLDRDAADIKQAQHRSMQALEKLGHAMDPPHPQPPTPTQGDRDPT